MPSIFMYRIKFFCGSVNQKNFLLRNGFSNETCILIHWKNSFQEFMGVGSKIWLQVQINDPEIGSHAHAEGSRLTVPAPRRIQIFCRSGDAF